MKQWALQDAKARLSELVRLASEPHFCTRPLLTPGVLREGADPIDLFEHSVRSNLL